MYWTFIAYVGLCTALERLTQRYRTITPAPTTLATFACIAELLPFFNLMVAPFLWFFYMKIFDQVTAEIAEAIAHERAHGGSQPQGQQAWGSSPPAPPAPAYGYGGGYGV